ncbi:hypothetical protein EQW78_11540 [Oerskovia turbata]|uniref:S1 motif domain-containing protein n=1 Tax=Oerskovia turbata TaxID=1713 RepID=A0A4Q1KUT3_9CELL|nr:hypothetical protein [Oerskovia turbata]RXR25834.1 hypothetical protein EQW73_10080 [Oerskovia turbata]RXR33400.1 hypothetical protein EQW78_11540 [Oerskovia turbata]
MVRRNRTKERARAGSVLGDATTPVPAEAAPTASPRTPPSGARWVADVDGARALAERLLTPGRAWPVVAISVAAGHAEPYVDLDELVDEVSGLAEVVVLPTGDASWAFSAVMPPATQVYGGAARVYPVDHEWVGAPRRSRLRFAYSESDAGRLLDHLVHDCLTAALGAGLLGAHRDPDAPRVEGTVRSILGPRAFVALDDDSLASIAEELTVPGVSLARLLVVGQRVTGTLDREGRRLDVRESLLLPDGATPPGADAGLGGYAVGQVVLADVAAVSAATVRLRLVPGLTVDVPRDAVTGNPADALTDLFTVGEVVLARVASTAPWALRLDDIDDIDGDDSTEVPVAAPSLLPGGPPWLVLPEVGHATPARALPELPPLRVPVVRAALGAPPDPGAPGEPGAADDTHVGDDTGAPAAPDPDDHPRPDGAAEGTLRRRTPLDLVAPADRPGARSSTAPPPAGRALRDMSLALEASRAQTRGLDTALAAARAENLTLRATLQATTVELAGLRRRAAELEHEAAAAQSRATNFQTKYRRADLSRQQLKKDQRATAHTDEHHDGIAFLDPAEQFRHEVATAWIRRVPAAEKASKPLAEYTLGDRFLTSLDALEGISRAKVVDVVVEVLTGDAEHIAGRELHPLRVNEGGGSPAVVRDDGATCWRASLQTRSASARRLHYWKRGDRIELSRVVLHDDMDP